VKLPKNIVVFYYGTPLLIEFPKETDNELNTGNVLLSNIGQQLVKICASTSTTEFHEYVMKKWSAQGLILSSIYNQNKATEHQAPLDRE
jgi:hypothetical protein